MKKQTDKERLNKILFYIEREQGFIGDLSECCQNVIKIRYDDIITIITKEIMEEVK